MTDTLNRSGNHSVNNLTESLRKNFRKLKNMSLVRRIKQFPSLLSKLKTHSSNRSGCFTHYYQYLNSFANLSFVSKYLDVRLSGIKNIEWINLKTPYIPKSKNKLVPTIRMSFSSPKNVKL